METTQIGPAGNFKIIIIVILNIVSIISTNMSNLIKKDPHPPECKCRRRPKMGWRTASVERLFNIMIAFCSDVF